jgi:glycosyltransferase involved in cell wall biosynthesis
MYIVSTLKQSGPTNQLFGIIQNLNQDTFDIKIITLADEPNDSRINDFKRLGLVIESLSLSRLGFIILGKNKLKLLLNKYKPNIIHTNGVRADTAISKLKYYSNHMMTIRNYAFDDYIDKYGVILGNILAISNINAMKKCKNVICCSNTLKDMYTKIRIKDLHTIQNGVDCNIYKPIKTIEDKYSLRDKLGIPRNKIVFISIGSLIKRKDPFTILNAFKTSNQDKKAVLIFLGEGELMNQLLVESNESIFLKGNINNVNDYLNISDFYISASKSEGLPNSVLEAASSGVELIISDIKQHLEIFKNNLDYVTIFQVGNINELTSIINSKISNFNEMINYNLSNYIEKNFSNLVMSTHYEKIYKDIFERSNL